MSQLWYLQADVVHEFEDITLKKRGFLERRAGSGLTKPPSQPFDLNESSCTCQVIAVAIMAFIFPQATVKILRNIYRNPARRKLPYLPIAVRYLHTTPYRAQREDDRFPAQANGATPSITSTIDDLDPELRAALESLSPEEQAEFRQAMAEVEYMSSPEAQADLKEEASLTANDFMDKIPYMESPPRVRTDKLGFMAEGEDDAEDIGEDPEYEADDITSLAHGELEQHRELRKYARLAVWEMPLLHSAPLIVLCAR